MKPPKIATDANPGWVEHLKKGSEKMVGKTVKKVSCGMREHNRHYNDLIDRYRISPRSEV